MDVAIQDFVLYDESIEPALFYEGQHYMYSNFSSFAVEIDGRVWPTAEHAYQAAKFIDHSMKVKVFEARSAHDAKKIARANDEFKRPDWTAVNLGVMERIVRAKLKQHIFIRERLLATGERMLIEDSPKDSFWGRGPDWQGQNHLGKMWMRLRDEIRSGEFDQE